MDGGAWLATVHGVTKSWARLSDFTITTDFKTVALSSKQIDVSVEQNREQKIVLHTNGKGSLLNK